MKDFLGRELAVNDFVILIEPNYRNYLLGQITAFTLKYARVEYTKHQRTRELLQCGSQLLKVEGVDLTLLLLSQ